MKSVKIYAVHVLAAAAVVAAPLWGVSCFKKVTHDTRIILKPNIQSESGGPFTQTTGVEAYASKRSASWYVASYEDAVACIATNADSGLTEVMEDAVEAEPYEWNDVEGLLSVRTKGAHQLLVAVYPAARMYAWRNYATAENLSQTWIAFQLRIWKSGGYDEGGWTMGFDSAGDEGDDGDNEQNETK